MKISHESLLEGYVDACPSIRKQIKLVYKCKPYSFHTSITCKGDPISLSCSPPRERIVIISGRFVSAMNSHIHCPLKDPVTALSQDSAMVADIDKCESSPVTRIVMSECHGKKYCHMIGDQAMMGSDICSHLHVMMRIVWTCTESRVIDDKYLEDEKSITENMDDNIPAIRTEYKIAETVESVVPATQDKTKDMDLEREYYNRQEMGKIKTKFRKDAKELIGLETSENILVAAREMSRPLTEVQNENGPLSQRGWKRFSRDYNPDILPLEQEDRDNMSIFQEKETVLLLTGLLLLVAIMTVLSILLFLLTLSKKTATQEIIPR